MGKSVITGIVVGVLLFAQWGTSVEGQTRFTLPGIPNPLVADGEVGRFGGTFVLTQISDPSTFSWRMIRDDASSGPTELFTEGLVEAHGLTTEIIPALAESWTVGKDGRTWVFKLREGVKWFDGVEFTADDVIFNFNVIFDPKIPNQTKDQLTIADKPITFRKLGKYKIEFKTPVPFGPFLRNIGTGLQPKHILEQAWNEGRFTQMWGINTPPKELIGTGPYIMQSYVPGQRITFLRNPNYYRVDKKGQRLPYLARVVRVIVPNLEASRLKFEAGETDTYAVRGVEFAAFKAREQQGNYTLYEGGPTFTLNFLALNLNPRGIRPPKLTWFSNQKFRQAVAHAVDKRTLIAQVFASRAVEQWGPVPIPAKAFYDESALKKYPYDLRRAEQLLAEAGFTKGGDGFLRDRDGNVVEFVLSTNAGNTEREAMGNIISTDLRKLGMKVAFTPEAFPSLVSKLTTSFNWEAIIIGLTGGVDAHVPTYWRSDGALHLWNPRQDNPATPWEIEMDRLVDQGASTVDQAKRKEIYKRLQEIVSDQVPLIFLVAPTVHTAVRNTLGNIRYGGAFRGVLWNLEEIFYKTPYR